MLIARAKVKQRKRWFVHLLSYVLLLHAARAQTSAASDIQNDGADIASATSARSEIFAATDSAEATLEPEFTMEPEPDAAPASNMALGTARNFLCFPLFRVFNVELRERTLKPGERIGLTGSHAVLGEWRVERSLALHMADDKGAQWYRKLAICANERIYYRYFIYTLDAAGHKRIREWEGQQHARLMESYELFRQPGVDVYGQAFETAVGGVPPERGWLRYEYVLQLKFVWYKHIRFTRPLGNARERRYRLKLAVLRRPHEQQQQQQRKKAPAYSLADTVLEVTRYAYNRSQLRQQPEKGVVYAEGDVVVFHITEPLKVRNSYQLVINALDGRALGEVLILATDLRQADEGVLKLPILSPNGFQIGVLTLPYLIVRPLLNAAQLNFRASFHHYWPLNWPAVDVGHRGAGTSFGSYSAAVFVENTIRSFLYIHQLNGEMVEFDVQLTKDYVPVLWHDFGFLSAPPGLNVTERADLEYLLIKDLNYKQLKARRVFVVKNQEIFEYTHLNVRDPVVLERIFPTLAEAYLSLPKTLGLNVEIKWPQRLQSGEMESPPPLQLDKNRCVNVLLQTTAKTGCGRALVFSSFDADICAMLRLKQNVFPVMFLSMGESGPWAPFRDLRTRSFADAVNFAQASDLLGTALHADEFLSDDAEERIDFGLDMGQAVFVWGDALRNAKTVAQLKRWAVTGVIYDRMEKFRPRDKVRSFFSAPELLEIFARQCVAVGNMTAARVSEVLAG